MARHLIELQDEAGNIFYPETLAQGVRMPDGTALPEALASLGGLTLVSGLASGVRHMKFSDGSILVYQKVTATVDFSKGQAVGPFYCADFTDGKSAGNIAQNFYYSSSIYPDTNVTLFSLLAADPEVFAVKSVLPPTLYAAGGATLDENGFVKLYATDNGVHTATVACLSIGRWKRVDGQ